MITLACISLAVMAFISLIRLLNVEIPLVRNNFKIVKMNEDHLLIRKLEWEIRKSEHKEVAAMERERLKIFEDRIKAISIVDLADELLKSGKLEKQIIEKIKLQTQAINTLKERGDGDH